MSTKTAEALHQWFMESKKTLAFTESCTGGLLASQITAYPGASQYFLGSLVVYSNTLKEKILNVSSKTIAVEGAVSSETVQEMLTGLLKVTTADFGVAVTGIAGPSGGSVQKPIGTIFYALGAKGGKIESGSFSIQGNRQTIMLSTCDQLLGKLLHYVMGYV